MLITERAVITPQRTARVQAVPTVQKQPIPVQKQTQPIVRVAPAPQVVAQTQAHIGIKRQNLLLLVLVALPLFGAVYNLLTFGLMR